MLSPADRKKILAALRDGKEAPDGPIIERFAPQALAEALEQEIIRTMAVYRDAPVMKISIHMDIDDARELAKCLRRMHVVE